MSAVSIGRIVIGIAAAFSLVACGGGDDGGTSSAAEGDERDDDSDDTTADSDDTISAGSDDTVTPIASTPAVDILTDFGDVCRGVPLPGATAYDPARVGVHPLVIMVGEEPTYRTTFETYPEQWAPDIGAEQTIELVVCMNRTSSTLIETCTGYLDDDDQDTGNAVELYDASYDVRVLAATTGAEIAATQLDATEDECPSFVFFDADEPVKQEFAEPVDALTSFLSAIAQT